MGGGGGRGVGGGLAVGFQPNKGATDGSCEEPPLAKLGGR
jgi:hypothetical protein